jgi:Raf kinase inhibitor-like YbhB/YbcL family protein
MTQSHPPQHAGAPLSIQAVMPIEQGAMTLRSPALDADGWIDPVHAADGDNGSPPLSWTRVLEAESFALVVEDPDAPGDTPFVHWLIWDIPGTATGLAPNIPAVARPGEPDGAVQGRNGAGLQGWYGPRPPVGHGVHRYHFQLFALARTLGMGPDIGLPELLNALKGNTLAAAELVGLYETRDPAAGPPPREAGVRRAGLDEDDVDHHAPHDADGTVRRRSGGQERTNP